MSSTQFQPAVKGKNNPAKIISPHCACVYLMMRLVELQEVKYGTFMYFNERSSFDTLHYTHAFSDKLVGKFWNRKKVITGRIGRGTWSMLGTNIDDRCLFLRLEIGSPYWQNINSRTLIAKGQIKSERIYEVQSYDEVLIFQNTNSNVWRISALKVYLKLNQKLVLITFSTHEKPSWNVQKNSDQI